MNKVSLQGAMAVGKTTVAKLLEREFDNKYKVLFEYTKKRPEGLDPKIEKDYYEIQKYFIALEIERYDQYLNDNVLFDLGPEEIDFFTINYPKSCGYDWDVKRNLKDELEKLHECSIDLVIYLDTEIDELVRRKENDKTRDRGFFRTYISKLHPLKKEWLIANYNTKVINIYNLSQQEVKERILDILEKNSKTS